MFDSSQFYHEIVHPLPAWVWIGLWIAVLVLVIILKIRDEL